MTSAQKNPRLNALPILKLIDDSWKKELGVRVIKFLQDEANIICNQLANKIMSKGRGNVNTVRS